MYYHCTTAHYGLRRRSSYHMVGPLVPWATQHVIIKTAANTIVKPTTKSTKCAALEGSIIQN